MRRFTLLLALIGHWLPVRTSRLGRERVLKSYQPRPSRRSTIPCHSRAIAAWPQEHPSALSFVSLTGQGTSRQRSELAVAARARGKALRSLQRFAALDGLETEAGFKCECIGLIELPLSVAAQTIAA